MPTTRKQTPRESRREALDSDYTALYAVAGLTEALAEVLKNALTETQERANERISDLQHRRADLRDQALESAAEMRTFVITLPEQVRHLPEATMARLAELQQQANELKAQASSTYTTFAGRGKRVVEEAVSEAAEKVDPLLEKVQEGVTVARRTVTGHAATETTVPKPPTPKPTATGTGTRRTGSPRTSPTSSTPTASTPTASTQTTGTDATAKRQAAARKGAATRAAKKAAAADSSGGVS